MARFKPEMRGWRSKRNGHLAISLEFIYSKNNFGEFEVLLIELPFTEILPCDYSSTKSSSRFDVWKWGKRNFIRIAIGWFRGIVATNHWYSHSSIWVKVNMIKKIIAEPKFQFCIFSFRSFFNSVNGEPSQPGGHTCPRW